MSECVSEGASFCFAIKNPLWKYTFPMCPYACPFDGWLVCLYFLKGRQLQFNYFIGALV